MVHAFVSSHALRFGVARIGVASFSVIAHAGLITIAAVTSGRSTSVFDRNVRVIPSEQLRFVTLRDLRSAAVLRNAGVARAARKAIRLIVPDLSTLRVVADASLTTLPKAPDVELDIDLASRITDRRDFADADTHTLLGGSTMWALAHPGRDGAYTQDVVEKTVWPLRDNPRPRYPAELQRAGIEGSVLVQFVVDSTGRVDAKTLAFPNDAQPGFLRAVKDALLRSRYFPAELAGMRVRQLVQQQFTFVIAR